MQNLERFGPGSDVVFRGLFCLIFIVAGAGHFIQEERMLAKLEAAELGHLASLVGPPELLMKLVGAVLVTGGLALALGYRTRLAAMGLLLTLVPITVTTHLGGDISHVGPFFKNLALMGGLAHFAIRGPGAFALGNQQALVHDGEARA